jgi:hypothetical protein
MGGMGPYGDIDWIDDDGEPEEDEINGPVWVGA